MGPYVMTEPLIVGYGRTYVEEYPVKEYRDALIMSFKTRQADYITLDDNPRGQKFVSANVAWAIDNDLLYNDLNMDDSQVVVSSFRLTDKGKEEILR